MVSPIIEWNFWLCEIMQTNRAPVKFHSAPRPQNFLVGRQTKMTVMKLTVRPHLRESLRIDARVARGGSWRLITFAAVIISASTGLSRKDSVGNSIQPVSSHTVTAKTTADKSSQVDALMARWSQGDTPGAAVIVIQDGRVAYKKGYGLANLKTKERINPRTVFDIASVSKQFTAMAVMILVERGKLNYADTLSKFFPEFQSDARQS